MKFQLDATVGYARAGSDAIGDSSTGSAGGGFGMSYRFKKHFLAESGMDYLGAHMFPETAAITQSGKDATITDHTVFVPLGARVVLPFNKERVLISAGGGLGIVHNYEVATGSGQIDCNGFCQSKTASGLYERAQLLFALDHSGHLGVGVTGTYSQAPIQSGDYTVFGGGFAERKNWFMLSAAFIFRI